MAHNLAEADLPWIELPGGWLLRFEARSTTTDAAVGSVNVSEIAIYGDMLNLGAALTVPIIPALSAEEVEALNN